MTIAQQRAARNRKPLPPAHGHCRWLAQPCAFHDGVLLIGDEPYTVHAHATGYTLEKRDGTSYDLPLTLDGCDCADSCYRHERGAGNCKHARALRAALTALGIDLPVPPRPAA